MQHFLANNQSHICQSQLNLSFSVFACRLPSPASPYYQQHSRQELNSTYPYPATLVRNYANI